LQIVAPFDGAVATRSAEPGEVVSPGTPIMTIVNLSNVYLRAFIPEGEIGRVRAGQTARVYLDSNPKHPLEAVVSRIDPQASFTPENTYYRDDRVKQVVGVKLQLTIPVFKCMKTVSHRGHREHREIIMSCGALCVLCGYSST
jgi:membrane fusion protein YbhG